MASISDDKTSYWTLKWTAYFTCLESDAQKWKVVRMTAQVFNGDIEACLQSCGEQGCHPSDLFVSLLKRAFRIKGSLAKWPIFCRQMHFHECIICRQMHFHEWKGFFFYDFHEVVLLRVPLTPKKIPSKAKSFAFKSSHKRHDNPNYQQFDCLFNGSSLRITCPYPHKGQVMQKHFSLMTSACLHIYEMHYNLHGSFYSVLTLKTVFLSRIHYVAMLHTHIILYIIIYITIIIICMFHIQVRLFQLPGSLPTATSRQRVDLAAALPACFHISTSMYYTTSASQTCLIGCGVASLATTILIGCGDFVWVSRWLPAW